MRQLHVTNLFLTPKNFGPYKNIHYTYQNQRQDMKKEKEKLYSSLDNKEKQAL